MTTKETRGGSATSGRGRLGPSGLTPAIAPEEKVDLPSSTLISHELAIESAAGGIIDTSAAPSVHPADSSGSVAASNLTGRPRVSFSDDNNFSGAAAAATGNSELSLIDPSKKKRRGFCLKVSLPLARTLEQVTDAIISTFMSRSPLPSDYEMETSHTFIITFRETSHGRAFFEAAQRFTPLNVAGASAKVSKLPQRNDASERPLKASKQSFSVQCSHCPRDVDPLRILALYGRPLGLALTDAGGFVGTFACATAVRLFSSEAYPFAIRGFEDSPDGLSFTPFNGVVPGFSQGLPKPPLPDRPALMVRAPCRLATSIISSIFVEFDPDLAIVDKSTRNPPSWGWEVSFSTMSKCEQAVSALLTSPSTEIRVSGVSLAISYTPKLFLKVHFPEGNLRMMAPIRHRLNTMSTVWPELHPFEWADKFLPVVLRGGGDASRLHLLDNATLYIRLDRTAEILAAIFGTILGAQLAPSIVSPIRQSTDVSAEPGDAPHEFWVAYYQKMRVPPPVARRLDTHLSIVLLMRTILC